MVNSYGGWEELRKEICRRKNLMKIEYRDFGATAGIFITSTIFEFRKHNRVIDAALLDLRNSCKP
jgi:hypothetical protein